ncbi:MAG: hypothetical protein KDJ14_09845 [Xanthomonadales bacterium]|nr:hypothetical protein [Xanthomonadales bacterium]
MSARMLLGLACACAAASAMAEPTPLPIGGSINVNLPAQSLTNDVYVDIPAGAERIKIRARTANTQRNIDLLLRFDETFPSTTIDGIPPDYSWLVEQAQYAGTSDFGDEVITISRASHQPVRQGRLFLSVVNLDSAQQTVTVTAESPAADAFEDINVIFDDPGTAQDSCNTSGWNDSTPVQPVRGNDGTTLGQQRRNALVEAARLLASELRPVTRVNIRACWDTLSSNSTLAQAGPRGFLYSDAFGDSGQLRATERYLERPFTFYSQAAAANMAGTPACSFVGGSCSTPDLEITYNLTIDQNQVNTQRFDYGLQAAGTVGSSFITVSMHEISHGLGFLGLINTRDSNGPIGAKLVDYDDIYGALARIGAGTPVPETPEFLRATDAERAVALTTPNMLRFSGENGIASIYNVFRAFAEPNRFIPLYTPTAIAPGSTYSHVAQGSGGALMQPSISGIFRELDIAADMFKDLGWISGDKPVPADILPPDAQFFDVTRSGHGFDIRRIDGTDDLYYLVFYTFDTQGNPEWYNAIGRVHDGLFMPERNPAGDSLANNLFREGQTPQTVIDTSPAFSGQIRVDYKGAANAPNCFGGPANRPVDDSLGVMTWALGVDADRWCVQPITVDSAGIQTDISGIWFDPTDSGWGITFVSFPGASGDGLAAQIYYPDATGAGRWGLMFTDSHVPGSTYPVFHPRNGYCRTCPASEVAFDQQIGTITVDIGGSGEPKVSIDITYPGAQGGRFMRTDSSVITASTRRF